jgi:hypothetical protein
MPRPAALLLCLLAACASGPAAQPLHDRQLAVVPGDAEIYPVAAFTPDGREVAFVIRKADAYHVIRGAWMSPPFDAI